MPAAKYKVTYIEDSGKAHTVDVAEGWSLMEGAVKHLIPGIDADCGGACSCATCMVYVAAEWQDRLPAKQPAEEQMLEFCPHVQDNSRLTCQIPVTDALDGLMVKVPPSQH